VAEVAEGGVVGIGVAVEAGIVVGVVAAGEDAGRGIVGVGTFVEAFEIVGGGFEGAAGFDEAGEALGVGVGDEGLAGDVGDVVGVFAAGFEGAGFDGLLEGALEIADQARGRELEGFHEGIADAGGERRELGVGFGERGDAIGEGADLLEELLATARAFGRDVGARKIEEVFHVREHLAVKAADGAVAALSRFGPGADPLRAFALFIVDRDV